MSSSSLRVACVALLLFFLTCNVQSSFALSANPNPNAELIGHVETATRILVQPNNSALPPVSQPLLSSPLSPDEGPQIPAFASAGPNPSLSSAGIKTGLGFSGLDYGQSGYVPSDGALAVGPNYIFQCVNFACEVWTKSGVSILAFSAYQLFSSLTGGAFDDPTVLYDHGSGEYFAVFSGLASAHGALVISNTLGGNPAGTWTTQVIPSCGLQFYKHCKSNLIADAARIGVTDDKFTISTNVFNSTSLAFLGNTVTVFNKESMVHFPGTVYYSQFLLPTAYASVQPAQSLTPVTRQYLITGDNWYSGFTKVLDLFSVTGIPGNTTVKMTKHPTNVTMPNYMIQPPAGDQPKTYFSGGTGTLNTDDNRIQTVVYRSGKIWFTYNDACIPSGDTAVRPCAGFSEISVKPLTVLQQFDVGIPGNGTFYPALGWSTKGIIAVIGFSSTRFFPGLMVVGRSNLDPPNIYRTPVVLVQGLWDENKGRWGDYFAASVDPSSTAKVWVEGTYMGANFQNEDNWQTYIASMTLA